MPIPSRFKKMEFLKLLILMRKKRWSKKERLSFEHEFETKLISEYGNSKSERNGGIWAEICDRFVNPDLTLGEEFSLLDRKSLIEVAMEFHPELKKLKKYDTRRKNNKSKGKFTSE